MKNSVYILSDALHSGKTTLLNNWIKNRTDVTGILSPKIGGKRHFQNIETHEVKLLEVENSNLNIGKYHFDELVFQWAINTLKEQFANDEEWIVIDEIGPLEIKFEKGFHQIIIDFLEVNDKTKKILFVVRDFLVDDFIQKYGIKKAEILPLNYFKNEHILPINGIVLAGGKSSRMETDKAELIYKEVPQWKAAENLLNNFCKNVYISINHEQAKTWAKSEQQNFVEDKVKFKNKGPISGILSVADENTEEGFFVLGIDYPFLQLKNLIQLNNLRSESYEAICFEKDGFVEPLCTIFEKSAIEKLKIYFENGGESLSKFLKTIETKKVKIAEEHFLKNVNSKEDYLAIKKKT